jgi:hypothetical protein
MTVTKEQFRRAIVAGWDNCIPRYHMDLDEAYQALINDDVHDDVKAGGLYPLDSYECWGREAS